MILEWIAEVGFWSICCLSVVAIIFIWCLFTVIHHYITCRLLGKVSSDGLETIERILEDD